MAFQDFRLSQARDIHNRLNKAVILISGDQHDTFEASFLVGLQFKIRDQRPHTEKVLGSNELVSVGFIVRLRHRTGLMMPIEILTTHRDEIDKIFTVIIDSFIDMANVVMGGQEISSFKAIALGRFGIHLSGISKHNPMGLDQSELCLACVGDHSFNRDRNQLPIGDRILLEDLQLSDLDANRIDNGFDDIIADNRDRGNDCRDRSQCRSQVVR